MNETKNGKLTIHMGLKTGSDIIFSDKLGEKEYLYPGEAREALESMTWTEAEEICRQKIDSSYALMIASWRMESADWIKESERLVLYFFEEERKD